MRVHFLGFDLDDERRELTRDGAALAVEPRVFDLLAYLVRHRNRVVLKNELLERLWPDNHVQEGTLSVCVHRARRLLDAAGQAAIQTVARRGYRFVAPTETSTSRSATRRDSLAGREPELAQLLGLVDALPRTRLRTFEVTGEAGIGKTALLEELGTEVRRRRIEVLRSAPAGETGEKSFSLWSQVIAAYVARHDARLMRRAMGEHVDALAHLVPALRRWASPAWADHAGASREPLFEAVTRAVLAATAERPLLLLFDDIESADKDSLAMLQRVLVRCADAPALIGVACRHASRNAAAVLGQMRAGSGHLRIHLRGLQGEAAQQFLERLSGPMSKAAVAAVVRATGGKPSRLEEWCRTAPDRRDAELSTQHEERKSSS